MKKNKIINLYFCILSFIAGIIVTMAVAYFPRIRYDVNKDGEVNALDLLKVQKYILKEQEKESEKNGIHKDDMGK